MATKAPSFKKSKLADRGKSAENAVNKFLVEWQDGDPHREFNRLTDTKAAGRIIKASAADFEYYARPSISPGAAPRFGLIEVKETEHEYRLARDKLPQLARMRKRAKCGGYCLVLVHHSTLRKWRVVSIPWLADNGDKGSWNLEEAGFELFDSPGAALAQGSTFPARSE